MLYRGHDGTEDDASEGDYCGPGGVPVYRTAVFVNEVDECNPRPVDERLHLSPPLAERPWSRVGLPKGAGEVSLHLVPSDKNEDKIGQGIPPVVARAPLVCLRRAAQAHTRRA